MLTNQPGVSWCDGCGVFYASDTPGSISRHFLDGHFIDFCGEACERRCYERGGELVGGRGTVLLLGRRTPAEWLAGVTNHGPEADVGNFFAWLR